MTTLLKQTVATAARVSEGQSKFIKMPKFNQTDSTDTVLRKMIDYRAKVRQAELAQGRKEGESYFPLFRRDDITLFSYNTLKDDEEQHLKSYLYSIVARNLRKPNKDLSLEEILAKSFVIKQERPKKTVYYVIIDDIIQPMQVKNMFATYTSRAERLNCSFGYCSLSMLELFLDNDIDDFYRYPHFRNLAKAILEEYADALDDELDNLSAFSSGNTLATVRTNKKYQDTVLNETTVFNQLGFKAVEVDTERYEGNEFDYEAFKIVENDWEKVCNLLPHSRQPELKFRKLGKHKATGLYVHNPSLTRDIVAVDVRYTEAFIHEYAHHLDFTYSEAGALSRTDGFAGIKKRYVETLSALLESNKASMSIKDFNYYTTPTEVFARGFELWSRNRFNEVRNTNLVNKTFYYATQVEYQAFKSVLTELYAFYDALLADYQAKGLDPFSVNVPMVAERSVDYTTINLEPTNIGEQLSLF
uniref:hypothetical protein n=1 Tax=Streptococcus pluranimalium TaxID=82348 RepID=UPI003F68F142